MRAEAELYAGGQSPVHVWDTRWKLVSFIALIAASCALQTIRTAGLALLISVAILLCARLPLALLFRRLAAIQLFLLPVFLILPFTFGGETLRWHGFNFSPEGLRMAGLMYLRALTIINLALVLLYSTPFFALMQTLQWFRFPSVMIQITLLTYRYVFVLWWELSRMRWGLATRGFRAVSSARSYATMANLVGVILVRSLERTERVQRAMHCRGYKGRMPSLHQFQTRPADLLKGMVGLATAVSLLIADRHNLFTGWGN